MDNFTALISGGSLDEDLVNDGWTDIIGNILLARDAGRKAGDAGRGRGRSMQLADFQKMEQVRARVDAIVKDPATAEALKPWYNQFCKRPCFHDEYLRHLQPAERPPGRHPGRGVERITEHGVVVDGHEYELDCLIYATGFEVGTDYTRRSGFEVYGRGGLTLTEKWTDGVSTLHGLLTRGFPNCFIVSNAQSGHGANFPHMINEQSKHIAYVIDQAPPARCSNDGAHRRSRGGLGAGSHRLRPRPAVLQAECTPGYYNNEGTSTRRRGERRLLAGSDRLHPPARGVARRRPTARTRTPARALRSRGVRAPGARR